jgi:hypothetical protein
MKAKATILMAAIVMAAVVVVAWQFKRIQSLEAERAALQAQNEQPVAAAESSQPAAQQVSSAPAQVSSAEMDELLRLRAQASRARQLEEENALLKSELQRATGRTASGLAANTASAPQAASAASPAADSKPVSSSENSLDLGPVEFTEGTPKRFDLGDGKSCTVTPVLLLNDRITIEVKLDNADGKDPSVVKVVANPGKQLGVWDSSGKLISLTPTIRTQ